MVVEQSQEATICWHGYHCVCLKTTLFLHFEMIQQSQMYSMS